MFNALKSKIRNKLMFGFILVSLGVIIVGYIGFNTISNIQKGYVQISAESLPLITQLDEMNYSCLRLISSTTEYAFLQSTNKNAPDDDQMGEEHNQLQATCNSCHDTFLQYKLKVEEKFPERLPQVNEISKWGKLLHRRSNELIEKNKRGTSPSDILEKREAMETAEIGFLGAVNFAINNTKSRLEEEQLHLDSTISASFKIILGFSVSTLLLSIFVGILISSSLTKPLIKLTQQTDNFRKGDMEATINVNSSDEIGILGKSFNEMAERIKFLIAKLQEELDVTKLTQAELKIKNIELFQSNMEKDKFFSIIAHDLRSPFQGLLGLTDIMIEGKEKFSPEEYNEYSHLLGEAVRSLYKLLENLLEWTQIHNGSIIYTPEIFDLTKIVSESVGSIHQRASQKGITIINEITDTYKVYSDDKLIGTILRNLISNAVKFTRRNGKVIIKSKIYDNGTMEISVEDNGVGIYENDIKKLFRMEEKVSSKGTEGELSTGLGLLLCKEFIEMQGGKIWVESEINKGSIFYFTIPAPTLNPTIDKG